MTPSSGIAAHGSFGDRDRNYRPRRFIMRSHVSAHGIPSVVSSGAQPSELPCAVVPLLNGYGICPMAEPSMPQPMELPATAPSETVAGIALGWAFIGFIPGISHSWSISHLYITHISSLSQLYIINPISLLIKELSKNVSKIIEKELSINAYKIPSSDTRQISIHPYENFSWHGHKNQNHTSS
jgi:hypothetical protein